MEIKIMSIEQLLRMPHLKSSFKHAIVFITTKPNYYNFGCTFFQILNIADTSNPAVAKSDVAMLQQLVYRCDSILYTSFNTIYVCCDAGLSRSPAVALYLARKLNLAGQAEKIKETYQFLSKPLLEKLEDTPWK